jgi:hypothetical protein
LKSCFDTTDLGQRITDSLIKFLREKGQSNFGLPLYFLGSQWDESRRSPDYRRERPRNSVFHLILLPFSTIKIRRYDTDVEKVRKIIKKKVYK